MYGLRKIAKDGRDNNFIWPLEIGAEVEAPFWNREPPTWHRGIGCLLNAKGMFGVPNIMGGEYWAVLEFDEKDIIFTGNLDCKVQRCKIVFLSENPEGLLQFFDWNNFDSDTAYQWAYHIGNRDIMIGKILKPEWVYFWALNIGNKDIMATRIKKGQPYYELFNMVEPIQDVMEF